MAKINASDLAEDLAAEMGISRKSAKAYAAFIFEDIRRYLENGDEVGLPMLGKLKMTVTAPRRGRNPHTDEPIDIPARNRITFEMSRKLRQIYDGARPSPESEDSGDEPDVDGGKES